MRTQWKPASFDRLRMYSVGLRMYSGKLRMYTSGWLKMHIGGMHGTIAKMLLGVVVALCCASCGPHMIDQPSIQPYERQMPDMPEGTVPTTGRLQTITLEQSRLPRNPVPATPINVKNGGIYYEYYCRMCHGVSGHGDGLVGQSYVPKPANLASPRVVSLSDGQLYWRMLHGVGHDPVMEETIIPSQRWPLVLYVRTLGKK